MPLADLGCNPEETWADEAQAPARGTEGIAGNGTYILVQCHDPTAGLVAGTVVIVEDRFRVEEADQRRKQLAIIAASRLPDEHFGWAMIKGTMRVRAESGSYVAGDQVRYANGRITKRASGTPTSFQSFGITANAGRSTGIDNKVECTIFNPIGQ